jgi:hypothetical protein
MLFRQIKEPSRRNRVGSDGIHIRRDHIREITFDTPHIVIFEIGARRTKWTVRHAANRQLLPPAEKKPAFGPQW